LIVALLAAHPLHGQDALERLNAAFRGAYADAKGAALARGGPVLMLAGDTLQLYRHDLKVAEEIIRPARYHRLKGVAHVPLALHLLLGSGPVPKERAAALRALVLAARADLGTWAGPVLARQERILDACLGLLDAQPAPGRLAQFAAALGPLLLANADEAAALELEALDGKVARLRRGLAPEDWRALRVVIIGSHMAREGEVAAQYFLRLLGEGAEGDRVVYAEGLWQPRDALDLLATHAVDLGAGAAFFGEPLRMHRDILADGARRWLDAHGQLGAMN
jgi:hypothetical protein